MAGSGKATKLYKALDNSAFESSKSRSFFSSPKSLYRLWGSSIFLSNWNQGSFPGVPGLGADADLSSPSGTEINHNWRQTFTPSIGLQRVDTDNIKFLHH